MINWQSPEVMEVCAKIYAKFTDVAAGIYLWYFATTLHHVELPLITRKLKITPAFIPYFLGRYGALTTSISLPLASRGTFLTNCILLNNILATFASVVICSSSTIMLLRPFALWRRSICVISFLLLNSFAQWAIGIAVALESIIPRWNHNIPSCESTIPTGSRSNPLLVTFYFYTLLFDFLLLVATVIGLHRQPTAKSSRLWTLLYKQGILYFLIALVVNLPVVVFVWLNFNGTMTIFFAVPGGSASVMASNAAFTSLLKMKDGSEVGHGQIRRDVESVSTTREDWIQKSEAADQLTTYIGLGLPFSNTVSNVTDEHSDVSEPIGESRRS